MDGAEPLVLAVVDFAHFFGRFLFVFDSSSLVGEGGRLDGLRNARDDVVIGASGLEGHSDVFIGEEDRDAMGEELGRCADERMSGEDVGGMSMSLNPSAAARSMRCSSLPTHALTLSTRSSPSIMPFTQESWKFVRICISSRTQIVPTSRYTSPSTSMSTSKLVS